MNGLLFKVIIRNVSHKYMFTLLGCLMPHNSDAWKLLHNSFLCSTWNDASWALFLKITFSYNSTAFPIMLWVEHIFVVDYVCLQCITRAFLIPSFQGCVRSQMWRRMSLTTDFQLSGLSSCPVHSGVLFLQTLCYILYA